MSYKTPSSTFQAGDTIRVIRPSITLPTGAEYTLTEGSFLMDESDWVVLPNGGEEWFSNRFEKVTTDTTIHAGDTLRVVEGYPSRLTRGATLIAAEDEDRRYGQPTVKVVGDPGNWYITHFEKIPAPDAHDYSGTEFDALFADARKIADDAGYCHIYDEMVAQLRPNVKPTTTNVDLIRTFKPNTLFTWTTNSGQIYTHLYLGDDTFFNIHLKRVENLNTSYDGHPCFDDIRGTITEGAY